MFIHILIHSHIYSHNDSHLTTKMYTSIVHINMLHTLFTYGLQVTPDSYFTQAPICDAKWYEHIHTHITYSQPPVPPTPTSLRYIPLRAHHPPSPHPLARRAILAQPHPPFALSAETRASDPSLIRGLGNQVAAQKTSEARKLVCPRLGSELSSEPSLGTRPSLGFGHWLGS